MSFPLSRCAVLWLGCMAGYSSSLQESVSFHDYSAPQGLRRLTLDQNADSIEGVVRAGAPWPGAPIGHVPSGTSTGGGNENQAFFGLLATSYGDDEEDIAEDSSTVANHYNGKKSQSSKEYTVRLTQSKKGSKSAKKEGSAESSKGSKKSTKSSEGSKGSKGSKSKGSKSGTRTREEDSRNSTSTTGGSETRRPTRAPTPSPKASEDATKVTKTAQPTSSSSQVDDSSDHANDEEEGSSTMMPTVASSHVVDDYERVSDFPSQAPTCQECDDIETSRVFNKFNSEQEQQSTRRHVAMVTVAIVTGVAALLWVVFVLMPAWRPNAYHARIEAIHNDSIAPDSKFSDSDVTVVVFEDDDHDDKDDDSDTEEDEALQA